MRKDDTEALRIDVILPLGQGPDRYVFLQPDADGARVLADHGCMLRQDGHSTVVVWDGIKSGEIVVQFAAMMSAEQAPLCAHNLQETPHQLRFDATVDGSGGVSVGMATAGSGAGDANVHVALRLTLNDTRKPTLNLEIPPALVYWSYILTTPTGATATLWDSAGVLEFEGPQKTILPNGTAADLWRSTQKVDAAMSLAAKPKAQTEGQAPLQLPRPSAMARALIQGTPDLEWQAFVYL